MGMVNNSVKEKWHKNTYRRFYIDVEIVVDDGEISTKLDIMLIGNQYVGKTGLLFQLIDHSYCEPYITTVGIDWKSKVLTSKGHEKLDVRMWDICKIIVLLLQQPETKLTIISE